MTRSLQHLGAYGVKGGKNRETQHGARGVFFGVRRCMTKNTRIIRALQLARVEQEQRCYEEAA